MIPKEIVNTVIKKSDVLFYMGYLSMVINLAFFYSSLKVDTSIFTYISILTLSLKIILTKFRLFEVFSSSFILLIGFFTLLYSKDNRMLWLAIVLVASKNVDIGKLIKWTFITLALLSSLFVLFYITGFTKSYMTQRGGYSFGFLHPNSCHYYFAMLIILYVFINFKKLNIRGIIIINVLNALLFSFTMSRSGFLTILLSSLYLFGIIMKPKLSAKISLACIVVMSFAILFILGFIIFYQPNTKLEFINSLMNNRIVQANFYYRYYGLHLFGEHLELLNIENPTAYLDIGYAKLLINNGIIPCLFVVAGYICILFKSIKSKNLSTFFLIFSILISASVENTSTFVFTNVSLVLLRCFIYNNYKFKGNLELMNLQVIDYIKKGKVQL